MIDLAVFRKRLTESGALRDDDQVVTDTIDRVQPRYAENWPKELHAAVRSALVRSGVKQPYRHQADAVASSLRGSDVVLESPTASGKTLSFAAPALDHLIRNPDSHALMIYPMKALAFDQRSQIDELCRPLRLKSYSYDGDTPANRRNQLRGEPPHILFTNPEYLNMSFLGWRDKWGNFLRNIGFVVIDEMHEYRGYFGGNMALLLRRFFLHLDRIGASPRVFLSTATCANPLEHARNLTGRDVEVVSAHNVLRPRRHFVFVKPDIPDYKYRDVLQQRVEQATLDALGMNLQVLVFCPTKRFLESAFSRCQHSLQEGGHDRHIVSAYHADLKSDRRQAIQEKVKRGDVRAVFTTNALELGLDIGGLDGVILAGFPSSIMSAWQQIGRAGRGWDQDAFVLFYAMNDPIDRFFVGNLNAFLNKPFDELVVDSDNETLIKNHLPMLSTETGGKIDESAKSILGRSFYRAAKDNPGRTPRGGYRPHPRLKMRGGIGESFDLKYQGDTIGKISALRKFREAYIGATFTFFGHKYVVHSHEESAVVIRDSEHKHIKTEASFSTVVTTGDIFDGVAYGNIEVYYGSLTVITNFLGYKTVDERTGAERSGGGSSAAYFRNRLHALWIVIPPEGEFKSVGVGLGLGGVEHLLRVGAMFVIPADRFDTSTYSRAGKDPTVYCYENYEGGIGIAKKLYSVWQRALGRGIQIAESCSCQRGCQNCIEPAKSYDVSSADIDKVRGAELGHEMLRDSSRGAVHKFRDGQMVPIVM